NLELEEKCSPLKISSNSSKKLNTKIKPIQKRKPEKCCQSCISTSKNSLLKKEKINVVRPKLTTGFAVNSQRFKKKNPVISPHSEMMHKTCNKSSNDDSNKFFSKMTSNSNLRISEGENSSEQKNYKLKNYYFIFCSGEECTKGNYIFYKQILRNNIFCDFNDVNKPEKYNEEKCAFNIENKQLYSENSSIAQFTKDENKITFLFTQKCFFYSNM
ncbi:hypothetical protein EDEG_03771, partial [Edhazardia aedis USNM 41457]